MKINEALANSAKTQLPHSKQHSRGANSKISRTLQTVHSPSCLQIDLSHISLKHDEELISTQPYVQ